MDTNILLGILGWIVVFYPAWSPRCRRMRKAGRLPGTRVQTIAPAVSRNTARQTGPAWEQDSPWDEVFEMAAMEDDL